MSEFKPHGSFTIKRSGNVLKVECEGPFNDELARNYARTYSSIMEVIQDDPWAVLVILRGESLLVPEAEDTVVELTRSRIKKQMKALVLMLENATFPELEIAQFQRIHERANANFVFRQHEKEARHWLSEQGFHYDPSLAVVVGSSMMESGSSA